MRKDFGPQSWLFPMPVLIIGTYDENGNPDAMNAAWGSIYDYNQVTVSLGSHLKAKAHIHRKTAQDVICTSVSANLQWQLFQTVFSFMAVSAHSAQHSWFSLITSALPSAFQH